MIIGIGIDLVEIERMERLLDRHPERGRRRLFTATEAAHCAGSRKPLESFAARFAAKEAVFKALRTGWAGGLAWREVEVVTESSGAPAVRLHGRAKAVADRQGVVRTHLTLTHTRDLAGAYVVLEGGADL